MKKSGYVFFDTEFANFATLELLSIGCMSESGEDSFYQEVSDFNAKECSDFVNKVVLPLMSGGEHAVTLQVLQENFKSWINQLPYDEIIFVSDYSGDQMILNRLLSSSSTKIVEKKVSSALLHKAFTQVCHERVLYDHRKIHKGFEALAKGIESHMAKFPQMQHHALFDAHANQSGWVQGLKYMKNA